jgi:hypothetical protein
MESALYSIGQIAVTLAGFAALLQAFRRKDVGDAHSDPRLLSIVEQGLVVALLCFMPTLLVEFGLTLQTAVRAVSTLAALWLTRWLFILYVVRTAELSKAVRRLFRVAVLNHVAAFCAFVLAATGIVGRVEPLYFCGVVVTIIEVGWTFLVQFQTERS